MYTLYDSETAEPIGPATEAQAEASMDASAEGHITIDAETGEVVPEDRVDDWCLMGGTIRMVYVCEGADHE